MIAKIPMIILGNAIANPIEDMVWDMTKFGYPDNRNMVPINN